MNNLFISLYKTGEKFELRKVLDTKKEYYKYNFFKYNYTSDMLNSNYGRNMSLKLDVDYILDKLINNKKYSLKMFNIKQNLKKELSGLQSVNVIFDNSYDELNDEYKDNIKQYVYDILSYDDIKINEIKSINKMYENDIKHIDEYIKKAKINENKLKILLILNEYSDYTEEKIKEYISKYKFVDILKMPNISKVEYKKILDSIEKINEEYGSTIDIITKKNIQEYQIYIMYSNVDKDYFFSHYILRKKSNYIEMKNVDFDKYNEGINEFEKNESYILTLATRLGLDIKRYSKNKVGNAILNK